MADFKSLFGPIRQWGFLVKNLHQAMDSWIKQLGVGPWWGYRNVGLQSHFRGQTTEAKINVGLSYQNGVQIELIEQTNDAMSPYRAFYDTPNSQMLHQVAYFVPDLDAAVKQGKTVGLVEHGYMTNPASRVYYLESPQLQGIVVELMQASADFEAEYQRCAKEAATWDGSNPYRLISF